MKKKSKKRKRKFIIVTFMFLSLGYILFGSVDESYQTISELRNNQEELSILLQNMQEEGEYLTQELTKFEDKDYILKYAREHFLYSSEGEIIFVFPK